MVTLSLVLVLVAAVLAVASAVNKAPLWAAVFALVVLHLVQILPR